MYHSNRFAPRAAVAPLALAAMMPLSLGCAPKEVQPRRTLRELYDLQAEVNKNADPYDMGTGAAPSRVNHERAAENATGEQ